MTQFRVLSWRITSCSFVIFAAKGSKERQGQLGIKCGVPFRTRESVNRETKRQKISLR